MNLQAVGKFLQRYGVPLIIGSMLAFGLIYTSLQTGGSTPAPQHLKATTASRIARVYQPTLARPTVEKTAENTRVSTEVEPSPAVETMSPEPLVSQTAEQAAVTLIATRPVVTTRPPVMQAVTPQVDPQRPTSLVQQTNTPTATIPAQPTQALAVVSSGPPLREPRARHTMTRLSNGRVLLVGGSRADDQQLSNVDQFDPAANAFSQLAAITPARQGHTATLLQDNRVLVTGGYNTAEMWIDDAAVYDFNTNAWTNVPPYYPHGMYHTATLMADGQVMVVGGCVGEDFCIDAVEIFDPSTNDWMGVASLDFGLYGHTAQLLNDDRVIVIGGISGEDIYPDDNALVYDPDENTWTATGPMIDPRYFAESVRLSDGRILVVGGLSIEALPEHRTLSSAEIYDPATNQWTAAGSLSQARYAFQLVKLSDRQVLAIGGTRAYESGWNANSFVGEIERYDTATKSWRTTGLLPHPVAFAASTILPDGRVWLAGGRNNTTYFQDTWLIANVP